MAIRQFEVPRNDGAEPFDHRLHAPVLPQEAVPAAGAEVGDAQLRQLAQALDLLPHARHRAGIEHLQLELADAAQHGARTQLHDHGERRDLPHRGLDPRAFEDQLVLVAVPLQMIGGKAEVLEPGHEVGREHLPLAVERVAAQPGAFATRQPQRTDVVELFAQLADVDQLARAARASMRLMMPNVTWRLR